MGIHVLVDREKQKADVWMCVTSGCARYEESENSVYASIEDRREDGLRVEKSVTLQKRGNYLELVHNVLNDVVSAVGSEPGADEGELLEIYNLVIEKIKRGMRYVGVKTVFTTPRGIQVYFRLRYHEQSGGPHIIVELIAEREGDRMVYQCFGQTTDAFALQKEAAKAIGAYVLFSEYIAKQADKQND